MLQIYVNKKNKPLSLKIINSKSLFLGKFSEIDSVSQKKLKHEKGNQCGRFGTELIEDCAH